MHRVNGHTSHSPHGGEVGGKGRYTHRASSIAVKVHTEFGGGRTGGASGPELARLLGPLAFRRIETGSDSYRLAHSKAQRQATA